MYDYSHQIYTYLQTHLPLIEDKLEHVISSVEQFFPFVVVVVILALIDHVLKKGDLL